MFNGIIWIDREDYIIFIHCSSQNSFFITPHRSLNPSHPSPPSACSTRCASSPRRSSRPPQQCRWPGSSDRCCVPSCGTTRGGGTGGTTRVSWGEKSWAGKTRKKTTGNMWKHLLSAMAMLVCWRCNPIHPMQIYGCQSKFENQQLAPKFWNNDYQPIITDPSLFGYPPQASTGVLVASQPLHLVQESIHQLTGVAKCFRATWIDKKSDAQIMTGSIPRNIH